MPSPVVEIQPINNIMLCANVPFDSTYTHTCLFGSVSAQHSYFASKAKYTWSNLTPSRYPNKIRLPISAGEAYACNYLCFQNANFSPKWFYCFIDAIEYVNPEVCFITVKLDVFQTWQFDFHVGVSYVVREHPTSDNYGEHTLLEPMEASEFVDEPGFKSGHLDSFDLVLMYARDDDHPGAGVQGGLFTGLSYSRVPESSEGAMLDLLQTLNAAGKIDSVVGSFYFPSDFYTQGSATKEINITVPKSITTLGDYTPRNKKLLCYPYNMLKVHNSLGSVNTYRYEYFSNIGSAAIFTMACALGSSPEVILFPHGYNGQGENFQETMSISGFPQFAFVHDTYKNWLAQNGNTFAFQQFAAIAGLGLSLAAPVAPPAGASAAAISAFNAAQDTKAVLSTLSTGLNMASNMVALADKSKVPNSSQGSQGSNTLTGLRAMDFYFSQHHIREDYAKCIDDYFDRFGYLTNRLKIPNMTGRPNYNYVQCVEADIQGNIPLGDIDIIKAAFSHGITFWHNVSKVGDYSVNNRPPGEGEV